MVERINMCILLLTTILFVSCKFFGNSGASKEDASLLDAANKISNSRIATSSGKQEENTSDTTGEDKKNKSIPEMLADVPAAATSKEKQETKNKLTEEDNKKLIDFFSKTKTYKYSLDSIYNKYTRSYGTIATYGSCGDYSIGCFSTGPSEKRKKALGELKKIN